MDITIYQINMGRDHNRIAFEGLDLLKMYQGSDKIDSRIYDRVFEGEVDCKDLEDVYRKFNLEHPEGYKGRSLSVSDVVEIVDENGDSTFHFCDSIGFKQIDFDPYLTEEYKEDKIKVVLCEPGKVARVAEISNTLAGLQKTVKGDIEQFCPYEEAVAIICNEEGKFNGMMPNRARLNELCKPVNRLLEAMNQQRMDTTLLPDARKAAEGILTLLRDVPPFDRLDMDFYLPGISKAFTPEGLKAYCKAQVSEPLSPEQLEAVRLVELRGRIVRVLGHLAYSLAEYKSGMERFALLLDAEGGDRTPDGLAESFGRCFPAEVRLNEETAWMALANETSQYLSILRPGEDRARLVKRIHYVSFVGMLRADFFEGLCVGHAPKKCRICGRWFLTTNARHTKYCGGFAPGDKLGRTCRQIGNLRGREQRELAPDHPLKKIYSRRMNTIDKKLERGTLDEETAAVMKRLAKSKMQLAISDVAYAQGGYAAEMEQAALLAEAHTRKK